MDSWEITMCSAVSHPANCQFQMQHSPDHSEETKLVLRVLSVYPRPKMEKQSGWGFTCKSQLVCWAMPIINLYHESCVKSPKFQYQDVTWSCIVNPTKKLEFVNLMIQVERYCLSLQNRQLVFTVHLLVDGKTSAVRKCEPFDLKYTEKRSDGYVIKVDKFIPTSDAIERKLKLRIEVNCFTKVS